MKFVNIFHKISTKKDVILSGTVILSAVYFLTDYIASNNYLIKLASFSTENIMNLLFSITSLVVSALFVSLFWANNVSQDQKDNYNNLIANWLISNIGKYSPIKIGTILLRINKRKNKKFLLKEIIGEQIILLLQGIGLIFYFLLNLEKFNIFVFFIIYITFINLVLKFITNKNKLKKRYLYLQLSLLFQFVGLMYFLKAFMVTNYPFVSMIYIISSSLSLVAFFIPSGLIVRESLFVFFLGYFNPIPNALYLASIVRLLTIFIDLLLLFIGFILRMNFDKK
jgi:hypothetical protein